MFCVFLLTQCFPAILIVANVGSDPGILQNLAGELRNELEHNCSKLNFFNFDRLDTEHAQFWPENSNTLPALYIFPVGIAKKNESDFCCWFWNRMFYSFGSRRQNRSNSTWKSDSSCQPLSYDSWKRLDFGFWRISLSVVYWFMVLKRPSWCRSMAISLTPMTEMHVFKKAVEMPFVGPYIAF